jgi:hypothetical protein
MRQHTKPNKTEDTKVRIKNLKAVWICAAAAVLMMRGAPVVHADDGDYKTMYDEQKKRNDDLEKRVAALETNGNTQMVAKADIPQKSLDFLGQTEISGFVSASYLYDFKDAQAGPKTVTGRTFDTHADQFAVNKFKLALEKPFVSSPTNWTVGYRADLIFGEDASVIHSSGFNLGTDGDLEQAFIDVNVPIGNGLKVIVGKTVTLMGVEVIEEVSNPNWSEGNQFLLVENFTQTGVQLMYQWNDKLDTEFVVFNGWDELPDNNNALSYMGRIGYALGSNTTLAFLGYGGPEQTAVDLGGTPPNSSGNWRDGAEAIVTQKITDKFSADLQLDYGHEENFTFADGTTVNNPEWYAAGVWLIYDFTDKIELAVRQDYMKDREDSRVGSSAAFPSPVGGPSIGEGTNPELYSTTVTLNLKPVDNFQFRPEIRWDHSDKHLYNNDGGLAPGARDQFTIGVGVAYLF